MQRQHSTSALPRSHTEIFNIKRTIDEVEIAPSDLDRVRGILDRLRKWHTWELCRQQSLRKYLLGKTFSRRPPCPSLQELRQLAVLFFPPRGSLLATVCEYGEGYFKRRDIPISDIKSGEPSPLILRLQSSKT